MLQRLTGSAICALLVLTGSSCDDPASPYVPADVPGRIRVDFSTQPGHWHADQLTIDSASIVKDVLHVNVRHGGGCARHEYAAVAWNGWLESSPVQVDAFVAHDANNDNCDALLLARLRFDLRPLRDAYQKAYGQGPAELIIRLAEAFPWNHGPVMLRYRF
ncbi:MAG: hypothetical protein ACRERX_08865 [Pseudomonas sp.]